MIDIGTDPRHVALFASDMHLDEADAGCARRFLSALAAAAPAATHLFLLGDLFEAWIGDDIGDEGGHESRHESGQAGGHAGGSLGANHDGDPTTSVAADFIALLSELVRRGMHAFVMRGNRDFLLDVALPGQAAQTTFTQQTGTQLLDDPATIRLFGQRVVLAHGDALCTDDVAYQRARTVVRSAHWQEDFLSRPRNERQAIARSLRDASQRVQAARLLTATEPSDLADLTDVSENAVIALLREHQADVLIHGHTHRPARHLHQIDERVCERWVLPDWCPARDGQAPRGGFLRVDRDGWKLEKSLTRPSG